MRGKPANGAVQNGNGAVPHYQRLKDYVIKHIENGDWLPAHRIPSENELVQQFNLSRMTVNRALRELASEGVITRVAGLGTFVSDARGQSDLLEIHNIADEVRQRGHHHSCKVLSCKAMPVPAHIAEKMQLKSKARVFYSVVLHMENHIPIQLEDRYVNPAIAPKYDKIDFTQKTPAEYLLETAPLQNVEHVVKAGMVEKKIRKLLHMEEAEACLVLHRRTWSKGKVASVATLYHPGNRYELSGQFKP